MTDLQLASVSKCFGTTRVIEELELQIRSGEFLALVGPSGCGKSTILRMIAGLEQPTAGDIIINGQKANGLNPKERGVAMVFQNYALYPHMTVRGNISFGLKLAGLSQSDIDTKVQDAASLLRLTEYLDKKPSQLSGGQKQRVAMGRAMVRNPKLFLFDEPLSNLDAALRVKMRAEIAELHRRLGCTTVYVTHDQVEAMTLADRIAVLNGGMIEQLAPPMELYHSPCTKFVASFIGMPSMNFALVKDHPEVKPPARATEFGVRPEDIIIGGMLKDERFDGLISLGQGVVKMIEPLGGSCHIHVELGAASAVVIETKFTGFPKTGTRVEVLAARAKMYWFDEMGKTISAPFAGEGS